MNGCASGYSGSVGITFSLESWGRPLWWQSRCLTVMTAPLSGNAGTYLRTSASRSSSFLSTSCIAATAGTGFEFDAQLNSVAVRLQPDHP